MATKANNHPLVKDLRRILDKHNLAGAVLVVIDDEGSTQAVSAGRTVPLCNAMGPVLDEPEVELLELEMYSALRNREENV